MYHAENVFMHSYILQQPEMENADIDWQTKRFIESLELTRKNDQKAGHDKK